MKRLLAFLRHSRGWNIRYGTVWMLQWQAAGWVSLGIHLDVIQRRVSSGRFAGYRYGPYVDLHLGVVIVSLGWRPYLCGELVNVSGVARGGMSVPTDDDLRVERIAWSWRTFVELCLIALLSISLFRTWLWFHLDPVVCEPRPCVIEEQP